MSSAGRRKTDQPESSISLDLAHGFLDAFRVMYPYLFECELPLQIAYEYKRLGGASGVECGVLRWPRHGPNIQTRIRLPLVF